MRRGVSPAFSSLETTITLPPFWAIAYPWVASEHFGRTTNPPELTWFEISAEALRGSLQHSNNKCSKLPQYAGTQGSIWGQLAAG